MPGLRSAILMTRICANGIDNFAESISFALHQRMLLLLLLLVLW